MDRVGGVGDRRFEGGEGELVRAQRPSQWMLGRCLHRLGAAEDDSGLGTSEELVAGDDDEIGTGPQRGIDVRFIGQRLIGGEESGAEVDDERKIVFGREPGQFGHLDRGGEALHAEVARMHFEQARRVLTDGLGVVGQVGAVRRSDLVQARSRGRHEVGEAEAGADLDELSAADDDLTARGGAPQGRDRQQQARGTVVDDEGVLGGRARSQQCGLRPGSALAALARGQVHLDVDVAGRLGDGSGRGR